MKMPYKTYKKLQIGILNNLKVWVQSFRNK